MFSLQLNLYILPIYIFMRSMRSCRKNSLDRLCLNFIISFHFIGDKQSEWWNQRIGSGRIIDHSLRFLFECFYDWEWALCAMCEMNDIDYVLFCIDLILVVVNYPLLSLTFFLHFHLITLVLFALFSVVDVVVLWLLYNIFKWIFFWKNKIFFSIVMRLFVGIFEFIKLMLNMLYCVVLCVCV